MSIDFLAGWKKANGNYLAFIGLAHPVLFFYFIGLDFKLSPYSMV